MPEPTTTTEEISGAGIVADTEIPAAEQAEPGNGEETAADPAAADSGPSKADILPTGITRVRGLRKTNLAQLLAIIGPNAKAMLELLAGFDPSHLQHLLVNLTAYGEIKLPMTEPAGAEERVLRAAQIFEAWSRMTPGTRDDDYSNWLNRILADTALRDEFAKLVSEEHPHILTYGGEKIADAMVAAGIKPADLLHFAETIRGIIKSLK